MRAVKLITATMIIFLGTSYFPSRICAAHAGAQKARNLCILLPLQSPAAPFALVGILGKKVNGPVVVGREIGFAAADDVLISFGPIRDGGEIVQWERESLTTQSKTSVPGMSPFRLILGLAPAGLMDNARSNAYFLAMSSSNRCQILQFDLLTKATASYALPPNTFPPSLLRMDGGFGIATNDGGLLVFSFDKRKFVRQIMPSIIKGRQLLFVPGKGLAAWAHDGHIQLIDKGKADQFSLPEDTQDYSVPENITFAISTPVNDRVVFGTGGTDKKADTIRELVVATFDRERVNTVRFPLAGDFIMAQVLSEDDMLLSAKDGRNIVFNLITGKTTPFELYPHSRYPGTDIPTIVATTAQ